MKNWIIHIAFCLLVLSSCTKEIKIVPKDYTEKLVVHSSLNSDSFIRVQVSKTNPVSSNVSYSSVTDAAINLYENGLLIGALVHNINGQYEIGLKPKIKKEYFLEVISGDQRCTAIDVLPDTVSVVSLKLDTVPFLSGQGFLQFTLEPSNILNSKEFYEVSAFLEVREYIELFGVIVDSIDAIRTINIETIDPIILANANNKNYKEQYLITDQALSLGTAIRFGTYDVKELKSNEKVKSITIILRSMSEDAYNYYNSVYNQIYYRSDPFSLPVKVQSNIQNGHGIFAGMQESRVTVSF